MKFTVTICRWKCRKVTNPAAKRATRILKKIWGEYTAYKLYRLNGDEDKEIARRCISTGPSPLDLGIVAMA